MTAEEREILIRPLSLMAPYLSGKKRLMSLQESASVMSMLNGLSDYKRGRPVLVEGVADHLLEYFKGHSQWIRVFSTYEEVDDVKSFYSGRFGKMAKNKWLSILNRFVDSDYRLVTRLARNKSRHGLMPARENNQIYQMANQFQNRYPESRIYFSEFHDMSGELDRTEPYLANVYIKDTKVHIQLNPGWIYAPSQAKELEQVTKAFERMLAELEVMMKMVLLTAKPEDEFDVSIEKDDEWVRDILKNQFDRQEKRDKFWAWVRLISPVCVMLWPFGFLVFKTAFFHPLAQLIVGGAISILSGIYFVIIFALEALAEKSWEKHNGKSSYFHSGLRAVDHAKTRHLFYERDVRKQTIEIREEQLLNISSDLHAESRFVNYQSAFERFRAMAFLVGDTEHQEDLDLETIFKWKLAEAELRQYYRLLGLHPVELSGSPYFGQNAPYRWIHIEILPGGFLFLTHNYSQLTPRTYKDAIESIHLNHLVGEYRDIPVSKKEMLKNRQPEISKTSKAPWYFRWAYRGFGFFYLAQIYDRLILYFWAKLALSRFLKEQPFPTKLRIVQEAPP